jgi:hypothetical protein
MHKIKRMVRTVTNNLPQHSHTGVIVGTALTGTTEANSTFNIGNRKYEHTTEQSHAYGPTTVQSSDSQNIGTHTHGFSIPAHEHQFQGGNINSWTGHTDYYQPYYVLAYIIKIS